MQQTFISKLEDNNNNMIEFERWNYKRVSTVISKVKTFYNECDYILKDAIKKGAVKLSVYRTESNGTNEKLIKVIPIELK